MKEDVDDSTHQTKKSSEQNVSRFRNDRWISIVVSENNNLNAPISEDNKKSNYINEDHVYHLKISNPKASAGFDTVQNIKRENDVISAASNQQPWGLEIGNSRKFTLQEPKSYRKYINRTNNSRSKDSTFDQNRELKYSVRSLTDNSYQSEDRVKCNPDFRPQYPSHQTCFTKPCPQIDIFVKNKSRTPIETWLISLMYGSKTN